MKVYVVTKADEGWDCVRGVFSSVENLAKFFTERKLEFEDENNDWIVKDFTGLSLHEIKIFLSDDNFYYIISEEELE